MTAGCPVRLVATSWTPPEGVTRTSTCLKIAAMEVDGEGAGAHGLDVIDGGVEAGGAEGVGPVVWLLSAEELVAAATGEVVEGGGGFGLEHRDDGAEGELGHVDGDEVDAQAAEDVE